jgi:hypothetical protein
MTVSKKTARDHWEIHPPVACDDPHCTFCKDCPHDIDTGESMTVTFLPPGFRVAIKGPDGHGLRQNTDWWTDTDICVDTVTLTAMGEVVYTLEEQYGPRKVPGTWRADQVTAATCYERAIVVSFPDYVLPE